MAAVPLLIPTDSPPFAVSPNQQNSKFDNRANLENHDRKIVTQ